MIAYQIAENEMQKRCHAALGINAELHMNKNIYLLGYQLDAMINFKYDVSEIEIVMAFDFEKEEPVGICLVNQNGLLMTFVKESYRRMGIGKQMLVELKKKIGNRECHYFAGGRDSVSCFYDKLGFENGDYLYETN